MAPNARAGCPAVAVSSEPVASWQPGDQRLRSCARRGETGSVEALGWIAFGRRGPGSVANRVRSGSPDRARRESPSTGSRWSFAQRPHHGQSFGAVSRRGRRWLVRSPSGVRAARHRVKIGRVAASSFRGRQGSDVQDRAGFARCASVVRVGVPILAPPHGTSKASALGALRSIRRTGTCRSHHAFADVVATHRGSPVRGGAQPRSHTVARFSSRWVVSRGGGARVIPRSRAEARERRSRRIPTVCRDRDMVEIP